MAGLCHNMMALNMVVKTGKNYPKLKIAEPEPKVYARKGVVQEGVCIECWLAFGFEVSSKPQKGRIQTYL